MYNEVTQEEANRLTRVIKKRLFYHLEIFEKSNSKQTNHGWEQLDTYSSFDICWTLPQEFLQQLRNLLDGLCGLKIMGKEAD